jgi:hypothetical protein
LVRLARTSFGAGSIDFFYSFDLMLELSFIREPFAGLAQKLRAPQDLFLQAKFEVLVRIAPRASRTLLLLALGIAAWACGPKPVWAGGGGGEDLGDAQDLLNGACALLTVGQDPCPQLPTISQIVLEIAGLIFDRPQAVRQDVKVSGSAVYASNVVTNSPIDLSTLTPLAFIVRLPVNSTIPPRIVSFMQSQRMELWKGSPAPNAKFDLRLLLANDSSFHQGPDRRENFAPTCDTSG